MAAARSQGELLELYATHRARALSIARRILRDPDEAEDVVQEVFIRLCFATDECFDGKSAYSTWLFRVMVNSSINSLRSRRRRDRLRHDPQPGVDPETAASGQELRRHFDAALAQVSAQHQQIIALRELRGLSYPEIAALLRIPEGTVKSALSRGRARVQAILREEGVAL